MDKLGINGGYFLFQVLNFMVMAILLYAWAYKPILNMLEKRKVKIAQGMEDARIAAEARANAEKEASKIIADAQTKAAQVVADATQRAEVAAREVKLSVEAEANREKEAALAEVLVERKKILGELRGQIAALAIAATQKLIGESLDQKRQHELINEFFSGIKSGKVTVLDGAELGGASAEVTSAIELTPEEKEIIKKEILAKAGSVVTVSFREDPSIMGGLLIRVGGKILDASVSGQLEGLRQNLQ
jgi:F-type H+-transporting ATPase subunit b